MYREKNAAEHRRVKKQNNHAIIVLILVVVSLVGALVLREYLERQEIERNLSTPEARAVLDGGLN
jgi:hypothetical protein